MTVPMLRETHAKAPTGSSFYIPSLDGMRAVAFLIVFLAHARLASRVPGNFGVTMFFFLSGYLITTLLRMEHEQAGRISLKQFYLRRVLRIFPPFYLILGVGVAMIVTGVFVGDAQFGPVSMQALHLSNYQIIINGYEGYPLGTYAYWSLAVEEHFYLVFPISYIMMLRHLRSRKKQGLALLAMCALLLLWRCILVFAMEVSKDRTYIATDTRVDSILFGCILAVWGNPVLDQPWLSERLLKLVLVPVSILVLLATFVVTNHEFKETFRYTIQGLALFPIFIAAMRYPRWFPFRPLNSQPLKYIGLLSYSLYLIHEIIIYTLYEKVDLPVVVKAAVALSLAIVLTSGIYYMIERPCARLRKRLSYRFRPHIVNGSREAESLQSERAAASAATSL